LEFEYLGNKTLGFRHLGIDSLGTKTLGFSHLG
jgi:hypothetical protein